MGAESLLGQLSKEARLSVDKTKDRGKTNMVVYFQGHCSEK